MDASTQKKNAQAFAERWCEHGDEKQETQRFWIDLLQSVYGVEDAARVIEFEKRVRLSHTSFIDGYIPETRVLIEQKGGTIDLRKSYTQSDGTSCTPYEQARRYANELPLSEKPRFIVVSNFKEFLVYDQEHPQDEPYAILLADLAHEYPRLSFLTSINEVHLKRQLSISFQAGSIVGKIYDAIHKEYREPQNPESLRSLNILCVRLVFCLYAEDAGLFLPNQFGDFIESRDPAHLRKALMELFEVLNTPKEERDPYLETELAAFPYVNGGLFASKAIEIPNFTEEIKEVLVSQASEDFDWSKISPTIFGAIFESTLNPETRHAGGMHYTSIENIHKVIDPLFLDALKAELQAIEEKLFYADRQRDAKGGRGKRGLLAADKQLLHAFQDKLASLHFMDPACGSGNFLTETYLSLRRLENRVLMYLAGSADLFIEDTVKVSIEQFCGIEINDFAVAVARTALWIAEAQMLEESNAILTQKVDFLPLRNHVDIVEGSALSVDWRELVARHHVNYIMGNPPFLGYSQQEKEQKEELLAVYVDVEGQPYGRSGKNDYVAGWFFKASEIMQDTGIRSAFVATNSITQGEQVAAVWKPLYERFGIHIDYAWRTFRWDSESLDVAAVHVVIIGFSCAPRSEPCVLFTDKGAEKVAQISPYLRNDAEVVIVESRKKPLSDVPPMTTGNRPSDGRHLIIEARDYADFIAKEPGALPFIKKLTGAEEYINHKDRYCLWLVGITPAQLRALPLVMKRVEACREARLKGADDRKKLAETPTVFRETRNPEHYIIVPYTSSENRDYLPVGFLDRSVIPTDAARIIENAGTYEFAVLISSVHMVWMRAVCGRLKSDYRYSKDIVYNNFPWPEVTETLRASIAAAGQKILEVRRLYPDSSLADLYDRLAMPLDLRKAHQHNDCLVMKAYGFERELTEQEIVDELLKRYRELVNRAEAAQRRPVRKRSAVKSVERRV